MYNIQPFEGYVMIGDQEGLRGRVMVFNATLNNISFISWTGQFY